MRKIDSKLLGKWGERFAEAFFVEKGMQIIERNYYTPYGELDLIARQNNNTVFIEVKTRTSDRFGNPEEAITSKKRQNLINSAQHFIMENPEMDGDWRIDILAIIIEENEENPKINWFENAIS